MYARVEDGTVKEVYYNLPKVWRNISNFNFLSREELSPFDFYPIVEIDEYDPLIYEVVGELFDFEEKDKIVKKHLILRKKPNKLEGG